MRSCTFGCVSKTGLMAALEALVGGPEGPEQGCPYGVNAAMVHHWCDALGDRNPLYLDDAVARANGRDGWVAPPAMLQAWTMRGLRPPTPEEEAHAASGAPTAMVLLREAGFTSVVATDCEQQYHRELRDGDRITHRTVLDAVSDEKQTGLGTGHFVTQRSEYRDADGELVAEMRFRMLWFRPGSGR